MSLSSKERLKELSINDSVKNYIIQNVLVFKKQIMMGQLNMNFVFSGESQEDKSMVGRLLAEFLFEEKILPTSTYIEVNKGDLVQRYIGQSAGLVNEAFKRAKGGVLCFNNIGDILSGSEDDKYGREALSAILQLKEKYRGELCLIFSDTKEGIEKFFSINQGFSSHLPNPISFD